MRIKVLVLALVLGLGACAQGGGELGDDDLPGDDDPGTPDAAPDARPTPQETACNNGLDDDNDGPKDCADPDCAGDSSCIVESNCANGADDENDGKADCLDIDCDGKNGCQFAQEKACSDGFDNDGDTTKDCADVNCHGVGMCESGTETKCKDGFDGDGDGSTDCADPDCAGNDLCIPEMVCADNADNDQDGKTDCADFDCDKQGVCEYATELTCGDGKDNDADGKLDCKDVDCNGKNGCEQPEVTCTDGKDNDADGASDCGDADCAGATNCVLGSCPAGSTAMVFSPANLPVAVPDDDFVDSAVTVPGPGIITKMMVRVFVSHGFDADLDISIIPPGGTALDLSSDNGSSGKNYANTIFDDAAATAITSGSAPFTGRFRPEASMAGLIGKLVNGTWTLRILDDFAPDGGTLESWGLYVCTCWGTAGCESGLSACTDGLDDDGDGKVDCADPDCSSLAQCAEQTCNDGVDNDGDGQTDCQEPQCAFACAAPACAAGELAIGLTGAGLPKAIPDTSSVVVNLPVYRAGTVKRLAARVNITHPYDADLDLSLKSPGATTRDLSSDNGTTGDNYTNTVFIDSATTAITAGMPPFTGSFKPEQAMSGFDNQAALGTWVFTVLDDGAGDTGTLASIELAICIAP